jgi:hypothetical protein
MQQYVNSISPDNPSELLAEIWNSNFHTTISTKTFSDVEPIMETIRRSLGWKSVRSVQTEIKRLGGQKRSSDGTAREYLRIPEKSNQPSNE